MRCWCSSTRRLVRICSTKPGLLRCSNPNKFPSRALTNPAFQSLDTAEMGKEKVSYQLKTPKGTKDCNSQLVSFVIAIKAFF